MATTGVSDFNLDLNDLIEEAFERAGRQLRSGYDFRTARRSLNLLTIEWANRGVNLWTVEQQQILMNTGQAIYPLPVDTIDILDSVVRQYNGEQTNQIDININRISESTYLTIPNKNATGRPIQVYVNRQTGALPAINQTTLSNPINSQDTTISLTSAVGLPTMGFIDVDGETIGYQNIVGNQIIGAWRGQNNTLAAGHLSGAKVYVNRLPCINVWPTPNPPGDQYTFVYYRMRRMQNVGDGSTTQDIPFRLIPAMVAGLAYHLSIKLEGVDPQRVVGLKAMYYETWMNASDEDRDKSALRITPRNFTYAQ